MTKPVREKFWSVAEVAAQLSVSKMTVYRLIDAKELRAHRVGNSIRVPESALRDFLWGSDTFGGQSK